MTTLNAAECAQVLEQARVAHVACIADGEPYVTPMSFVMIGGVLYFRTALGRRVDALRQDPRVSVSAAKIGEDDSWRSVLIQGTARFVDDGRIEEDVIAALIHKYGNSPLSVSKPAILPEESPVVAVDAAEMTGRSSGDPLSPGIHPGRV
ncbi:MAG: pyridoxamine 5'-phosphate oxidase family protein [Actinomycetota bacterium]|nr:pyridoxamine 5'-phosphate oxidase family protein [Actinomycetota bacterium]